jgi:hypothetical protein
MAAAAALPAGLLLAALRVPMAASAAGDERPAAPAPSPVPPTFALVAAGYGFGPLGDRRTALRRPEPRKGRNRRQ